MIQIKNKYTQEIIHEGDFATIKDCVEDAVQKGISLAWVNLENADLTYANLENANLTYAYLELANLEDAYLELANLVNANLINANLTNANLENANLTYASLENANLENANLINANLTDANLADAYLELANLEDAYLELANLAGANLTNANLKNANLENANLEDAYLELANLVNANLINANLTNANLENAKMPDKPVILPPVGEAIIGFKKLANNIVIKVEIPADANRVSTWKNRKCRASALRVIEVISNPNNIPTDHMPGLHDPNFVYSLAKPETSGEAGDKLGELHFPHEFNSDERDDCQPGLHFFMTLEEAKEWQL